MIRRCVKYSNVEYIFQNVRFFYVMRHLQDEDTARPLASSQ